MVDKEKIKKAVRMILEALGEDPDRPGLKATPDRVADMYEEIFSGYDNDEGIVYFKGSADMVIVKNIRFISMCEHHILPFYGVVDVAYVPSGELIGISKIVRIVQKYAGRLQLQERLTEQIADELYESRFRPKGVLVVSAAKHMCMIIRGVRNPSTIMTMALRGVFKDDKALLDRAVMLLSRTHPTLEMDLSR